MDWISVASWPLTGASLLGVVLNIQKKRSCFFIWAGTNLSWTIVDLLRGIPAQALLFFIYFLLALWGVFKWKD